jgi:ABC-type phosphate transport system substrate-binding protein
VIHRRLVLCLPFALIATRASASGGPPFVVIIHPQNPYVSLDRGFLSDAFLKKTTRWADGSVIKPVDLPAGSPVRERFSEDVLKRSVAAVKSYWEQIIFSGRDVPPPEVATDDEVVKYVLAHTGAVGYVGGSVKLGDARAVTIHE